MGTPSHAAWQVQMGELPTARNPPPSRLGHPSCSAEAGKKIDGLPHAACGHDTHITLHFVQSWAAARAFGAHREPARANDLRLFFSALLVLIASRARASCRYLCCRAWGRHLI